jgi:hypothetical protein
VNDSHVCYEQNQDSIPSEQCVNNALNELGDPKLHVSGFRWEEKFPIPRECVLKSEPVHLVSSQVAGLERAYIVLGLTLNLPGE